VDNSPPLHDSVPEQGHRKVRAVRKALEFGAVRKDELQLKYPIQNITREATREFVWYGELNGPEPSSLTFPGLNKWLWISSRQACQGSHLEFHTHDSL